MAHLHLDGDDLRVTFTTTEKLAGALRDVRVPLSALRDVTLVPRPSTAPRGLSSPGLAVPRRRWLGTWRRPGHQTVTDFDTQPLLATIRVPVLAITGDKDIQVDPADLDVIADVVPGPVDTVRVPDLTHLLRRSNVPGFRTYRRLARRSTDPEVLAQVGNWAAEHVLAPATTAPQNGA